MCSARTLAELEPGESAVVDRLQAAGGLRRRLMDIGLIEGTRVRCVGRSPLGDPSAYLVREAVIALRFSDSQKVFLSK